MVAGGGGAVVGWQDGGACVLEGVQRVEVELREAVGFLGGGEARLGRAHVDGWGAHAHGWGHVSRMSAARVVRADGEGLELGVGVVFGGRAFGEGDGTLGADATRRDVAGLVAEDEARDDVEDADND